MSKLHEASDWWQASHKQFLLPRNNENVFNNRIKYKSKSEKVIWVINNHIPNTKSTAEDFHSHSTGDSLLGSQFVK
jgi:hypothetical protein